MSTLFLGLPYRVVIESFRSENDRFHIHKRDDGSFVLAFADNGAFVVIKDKESLEELSEIVDLCAVHQGEVDKDDIPF